MTRWGPSWAKAHPEEKWLKTGQVAELLDMDRRTVRKLADEGRLVMLRTPRGERRYTQRSVKALLLESLGRLEGEGEPCHE